MSVPIHMYAQTLFSTQKCLGMLSDLLVRFYIPTRVEANNKRSSPIQLITATDRIEELPKPGRVGVECTNPGSGTKP